MLRFVLCADDFALTEGVSRSILALLEAGAISATGAMTNRPAWPALAPELARFGGRADLGLHLNLTAGAPLTRMPTLAPEGRLPPLGGLMRLAVLSGAARAEIAAETAAQLDAFAAAMGRAPDFLDGHQHAHAMPGVREALFAALARHPAARGADGGGLWLRDPADGPVAILQRGVSAGKALSIAALAAGFGARARRAGLRTNAGFGGVSPFDPGRDLAADLRAALVRPGPRHLVMCHPGFADAELAGLDPVVATRPREHEALLALARDPAGWGCPAALVRLGAW